MKYLFTGASGFLGNNLINTFSVNHEVCSLDGADKDYFKVDITRNFSLNRSLYIDGVIHAAGKAHFIPRNTEEANIFYKVNYEGTKNLCTALENLEKKPRAFIFVSTVAVYGLSDGEKIFEDKPLNGNTPYAESKILAEEFLTSWARRNGIVLSILRLPLVAGLKPPGNLGAMINGIKSGKYLSIGQANAKKSIVWAEDIARIIPKLSEIGGTFNLTDGYHPTFAELENAIAASLGKKDPIHIPSWGAKGLAYLGDLLGAKFPLNSDKLKKITSTLTFDDTKAREQLGWNPTPVLQKIPTIV